MDFGLGLWTWTLDLDLDCDNINNSLPESYRYQAPGVEASKQGKMKESVEAAPGQEILRFIIQQEKQSATNNKGNTESIHHKNETEINIKH